MAFILSGGLRDAPAPSTPMRPRTMMFVNNGVRRAGGAMVPMTTKFVPQRHVRVPGGRSAFVPHQDVDNHNQDPSQPPTDDFRDRRVGGADPVGVTAVVVHQHNHDEDDDDDKDRVSETFMPETLVFHTTDKLLHAIESRRKPILLAYSSGDSIVVHKHLADALQELSWPRVCLDHHREHHGTPEDGDETTTYSRSTMPAPGGDVQVLRSTRSLKPHTRILLLSGWLLPWGAYESLVTVKWRTSTSTRPSKKDVQQTHGGADVVVVVADGGGSERKKGACHSGRSRGRGFSLQKNAMHERVHGGTQYALWMLNDPSDTHNRTSEDLRSLQHAFDAQRCSNAHCCNVDVMHAVDLDGRELTWLETNQHVPPDTLLCANLSDFYVHAP